MTEPFVGEVRIFGFNFAPVDHAFCDGSLLPVRQYSALYSLIGINYGGDGANFALPDLRSRLMRGVGSGPGLTPRTLGSVDGQESVTLTTSELPPHTHALRALLGRAAPRSAGAASNGSSSLGAYVGAAPYTPAAGMVAMSPAAVTTAGASQPHDNVQPVLAMNACIAVNGVYPSYS